MNVVVVGQIIRKILSAALGAWLLTLVNSGLLEQGTVDQWLEATGAVVAFLIVAGWTKFILPWIKFKFQK